MVDLKKFLDENLPKGYKVFTSGDLIDIGTGLADGNYPFIPVSFVIKRKIWWIFWHTVGWFSEGDNECFVLSEEEALIETLQKKMDSMNLQHYFFVKR